VAGTKAWAGALDLGGIAVVNVELRRLKKSTRYESFRTLGPDGSPVRSVYLDSNDEEVDRNQCQKGVQVGKGEKATYKALSAEALERIQEGGKDEIVEPRQFTHLEAVPLELSDMAYQVLPDKNVPGAERSVQTLWNGLLATKLAYVTEIVMAGGGPDKIIVVYANDRGLWAVAIPYEAELWGTDSVDWKVDRKAGNKFAAAIEALGLKIEAFDLSAFKSQYRERRQAVIAEALAGKKVAKSKAKVKASPPDLMAALEASLAEGEKRAKASHSKRTRKAPAKSRAKTTTRKRGS
jgi:non-homologous end joining protein Ku